MYMYIYIIRVYIHITYIFLLKAFIKDWNLKRIGILNQTPLISKIGPFTLYMFQSLFKPFFQGVLSFFKAFFKGNDREDGDHMFQPFLRPFFRASYPF